MSSAPSRLFPSLSLPCSPTPYLSFFFNDTPTTEIYTLSLHDALPSYWYPQKESADGQGYVDDDAAMLIVLRELQKLVNGA